MQIYTGGLGHIAIDSAGRLGIGTTSPDATSQLHIVGSSYQPLCVNTTGIGGGGATFFHSGTQALYVGTGGGSWLTGSSTADGLVRSEANLIFATGGNNQRAQIDSSGRLLVGTSSTRTWGGVTGQFLFEGTGFSTSPFFISNSNDQYGCFLTLGKSRGTSVGSNTVVQSGDYLGEISFVGADGSVLRQGAGIAAWVDGTPGSNDMPGRLVFSTTADGASSPTERMRISQNGQVQVSNALDSFLILSTASAGTSNYLLAGNNNAATAIFIYSNGNIENTNNSYGAISDLKLKENIVDASSQWDDLKALQVRNYNFKEGQTHTQIGLVAQEVELVSPGLVSESPDRDEDGNDLGTVTKSVNYSVLYMKAVKALQEAIGRIETLEAEVAALKAP
jgi:hypothetical protein